VSAGCACAKLAFSALGWLVLAVSALGWLVLAFSALGWLVFAVSALGWLVLAVSALGWLVVAISALGWLVHKAVLHGMVVWKLHFCQYICLEVSLVHSSNKRMQYRMSRLTPILSGHRPCFGWVGGGGVQYPSEQPCPFEP